MNMNPIDLNCFTNLNDVERQQVIDYLDSCHTDMVEDGNTKKALLIGLEWVLQGLGAEGYEFT